MQQLFHKIPRNNPRKIPLQNSIPGGFSISVFDQRVLQCFNQGTFSRSHYGILHQQTIPHPSLQQGRDHQVVPAFIPESVL